MLKVLVGGECKGDLAGLAGATVLTGVGVVSSSCGGELEPRASRRASVSRAHWCSSSPTAMAHPISSGCATASNGLLGSTIYISSLLLSPLFFPDTLRERILYLEGRAGEEPLRKVREESHLPQSQAALVLHQLYHCSSKPWIPLMGCLLFI